MKAGPTPCETLSGRGLEAAGPAEAASPPEAARRLSLDLEDLRFENGTLRARLARAQAEILALSDRNIVLQRRLDRLARLVPRGTPRLLRWLRRRMRRR